MSDIIIKTNLTHRQYLNLCDIYKRNISKTHTVYNEADLDKMRASIELWESENPTMPHGDAL